MELEVESFEKHINVGVGEMASLVDELRNGSDKPAILITVDEMPEIFKINICSFNTSRLGLMLILVEAVKMMSNTLQEDMHERPGALQ